MVVIFMDYVSSQVYEQFNSYGEAAGPSFSKAHMSSKKTIELFSTTMRFPIGLIISKIVAWFQK